jgi:hypothetical protein
VFVYHGICYGICLAVCPKFCFVKNKKIKIHGLPEFALGPPLGGGLDKKFGRP